MTNTIHVPPGEAGDEAIARMLPKLWRMAKSEQNARRSDQ